jgi:CRP/FNR family transcriptional regulator, cyclic AMP receptor protein
MADIDFKLLANSDALPFKAGEIIFHEGDQGNELYVVQSGSVQISIGGRIVETLSEHGIFGEIALIEDTPRNATALALTDTHVVPVGEKQFLFLVRETPYFALNVMRVLARRLIASNKLI